VVHRARVRFVRGSAAGVKPNDQIARSPANPELINSNGPAIKIVLANYSDTGASQVTLTLKTNLKPGVSYRAPNR
jgi:hypothetical protein